MALPTDWDRLDGVAQEESQDNSSRPDRLRSPPGWGGLFELQGQSWAQLQMELANNTSVPLSL